jgi:hypothetical protein
MTNLQFQTMLVPPLEIGLAPNQDLVMQRWIPPGKRRRRSRAERSNDCASWICCS